MFSSLSSTVSRSWKNWFTVLLDSTSGRNNWRLQDALSSSRPVRCWGIPDGAGFVGTGRRHGAGPVRPNRRTALVVDPPDGRIPPLTAEARKRQADAAAYERAKGADVQTPGLYTRCITGNGGPPRIQGGVSAESQIFQAPGYVVLS